jgi:hypothetical protein
VAPLAGVPADRPGPGAGGGSDRRQRLRLPFVALPLLRVIWQGFFDPVTGELSLKYFAQLVDPYYAPTCGAPSQHDGDGVGRSHRRHDPGLYLCLCAGALQHALCRRDPRRHLLPTISPPFAIAIAAILLFGRNGLITRQMLGMRFGPGDNDIYGLDGSSSCRSSPSSRWPI